MGEKMRWTSAAPSSPTAPVGETGGTRWLEGWSTFSMVSSKESAKAGTVGTNAKAATSSAVEVRVGPASVEKMIIQSRWKQIEQCANVSHITIYQYEWREIRAQIQNIHISHSKFIWVCRMISYRKC